MANRYDAIANDRERLERTAKNSIRTLSTLYADRTHFIFELLQNAEDALRRRPQGWSGRRSVTFTLDKLCLRLNHWGGPFDEGDVRAICSVGETTKSLTDIGHFGIGFKSVYAFTDRPEVHSGQEDFAIEDFVRPVSVPSIQRDADETVILIPRKHSDDGFSADIRVGLQRVGAGALLFLREIEEIEWSVEEGPSGHYLRSKPEELGDGVRSITVIGQEQGKAEVDESWLVFSRAVTQDTGGHVGNVEIAFSNTQDQKSRGESIHRVEHSPLVVFFPTVLETHLGFLIQGPYRTTPSRDNVPHSDVWNQRLVKETSSLLVEALRWLRDHDFLNSTALQCLPLDPTKFGDSSMFAPLFLATKKALQCDSLLPCFDSGYGAADQVRLARTHELRDLVTPAQLAALYGQTNELFWLSAEITQERTPGLRRYLTQELLVAEVTPETIISRLSEPFLRAQPDSWILDLYHFLNGQPALRTRVSNIPLIRLQDGSYVPPVANNRAQAFLPGKLTTGFPTVRAAVCSTETAREFLRSLGLTEPNPVDDVIQNVLPRFRDSKIDVSTQRYEASVARILAAFDVDSKVQREKLGGALRDTAFVMAVDAGTNGKKLAKPTEVYLATERLKNLFDGVGGVLLVDDEYACLRGEDVRELLEACGAVRYLRPVPSSSLPWEMLRELRAQVGHVDTSGQNDRVSDWLLSGLDPLLRTLRTLEKEQRIIKTQLLWEELAHLEERRGKAVFTGEYTWTHYGNYRNTFDAGFVRRLNSTAWVPDAHGGIEKPEFVVFETLGWKADPFLLSKIHFKPRIIETLANQVGIEPGVLDLLKKLGLTSEADLRAKLAKAGIVEPTTIDQETSIKSVDDAVKAMGLDDPTKGVDDPSARDSGEPNGSGSSQAHGAVRGSAGGDNPRSSRSHGEISSDRPGTRGSDNGKRTVGSVGGRPFISYVGVHPDDEEPDPDGLDQPARMALEAQAIEFILSRETGWQRTPTHNPGFDLFESGPDGQAVRWCEVKAMTGCLDDRPVGLSRTQFDCARERGESYWLYVVEHVGTGSARIVRIQDPARKTRTFTFDKGWRAVAERDSSA